MNPLTKNAGRSTRLVATIALLASCDGPTEPRVATHIKALSPVTLSGTVGAEVTPAPTVRVGDQYGAGVKGIEILFWTTDERGVLKQTTVLTDVNGVATTAWVLGTTAGRQRLTAMTASPLPGNMNQTSFVAVARAAAPATLVAMEHMQSATPGATLTLHARVADRFGNGVDNELVTFVVESGGGTVTAKAYTDSTGIAQAKWTVGGTGDGAVIASVAGLESVRFGAVIATPLAHYELEPLRGAWISMPTGSITLLEGGRFETTISGLAGSGSYTIAGSNIVFTYANGFLAALGATKDWWAYPHSSTEERGSITSETITIKRCWGEDCYEFDWTYRRR